MDVNFYGAVYCTYFALPYLKQSRRRIVAMSSMGGKAAILFNTPYIVSRYTMHGFYDALRMELTSHGVSVTVVCPYWVVTEFHKAQMNKDGVPRGTCGRALYTEKVMTAERCAEITLRAAHRRRREVLIGPGALVKWHKLLTPGLVDWLEVKMFLEPAICCAKADQSEMKS
jgi:short-subunit dehydrogenase